MKRNTFIIILLLMIGSTISPSAFAQGDLSVCCKTYDEIRQFDGKRVRLVGVYEKTAVTKKIRPTDEAYVLDLNTPGTVKIETDGGYLVMLEIYHGPKGVRPVEEIKKFNEKKVEIIGILHEMTPTSYSKEGMPMQTMVGPYIEVEEMRLLSSES